MTNISQRNLDEALEIPIDGFYYYYYKGFFKNLSLISIFQE